MGWFTDTLAKRLFLLMWAALVASHLAAFAAVHLLHFERGTPARLPVFPSLPPTPGLPQDEHGSQRPPPGPPPPDSLAEPPPQATGLPTDALMLDYGMRLLVIALAAWFGSRWVAAPVRRLVQASQTLGEALGGQEPLPELDEHSGSQEVREAARVFNRMARELQRQFSERGLMMAAISHDLRTPLTRLRMRLETMDAAPVLRERSVADIREMNGLIDTVLTLFRSQTHAVEPLQDTDIDALLQALSDDLIEQRQPVTYTAAPAIARARPLALRRVLGNLLGNALRYGGRADISVESRGRQVCIRIDDSGPGIPPAQLEAVFQPFYRLEGSRSRDTGGMGLGLYIARDLMQRQGGSLHLINRPEGGLRAELRLPLATPD
ncbi:ATP-binding protein [Paucibacter sp. PLA-PC-4]|uniref:ATP-binding protein n=1 Tax=Paucibacter sp. PLA-PC-4 TaxID=2993655 RepID=UPI00224ACCCE|nr:ATP-binding protein [Paucibacter sp. PLA-PC-4]MCX2865557.1 ATP-binding protein [Paucibacter sp. PLA-PC-4]